MWRDLKSLRVDSLSRGAETEQVKVAFMTELHGTLTMESAGSCKLSSGSHACICSGTGCPPQVGRRGAKKTEVVDWLLEHGVEGQRVFDFLFSFSLFFPPPR